MNRKATRRITITIVAIGIAGFGLLQGIPLLIDKDKLRLSIEDGLHKSMGLNFRIQELEVEPTLFRGLQVHLNTSTISDLRKNPLGTIRNITVQIRYLPLLTEQLPEIAKIHLNHVRIPVGKYNLFKEIKLKLVKPEQTGFLKPAEMRDAEILLTDYLIEDVVIDDTVQVMYPRAGQFRVEGNELSIRHLESDKPISLVGNGIFTYSVQAKPVPKGAAKPAAPPKLQLATYRMIMEVPQDAVKKGNLSAESLARLELVMRGKGLNLDLAYKHKAKQDGTGSIKGSGLDLKRGQAVALQLGDTFGVPMPEGLSHFLLTGYSTIQNRFQLGFDKGQPKIRSTVGELKLTNVLASQLPIWPRPLADRINGHIQMNGSELTMKNLSFRVEGLPLAMQGRYNLQTEKVDAVLTGHRLQVNSLQQMLANQGTPPEVLQGRNIGGILDIYAHVTGTSRHPVYKGLLKIQNGRFEDIAQGLMASGIQGTVQFNGAGIEKPTLHYNGKLNVNDGKLISEKQGLRVNRFNGQIAFNGQVTPGTQAPPLPDYSGQINVQDAEYKDPKTGLPVQSIRGVLKLAGKLIRLEGFRGVLGGSEFLANGTITPNLNNPPASEYSIHLTGNEINIQRFKNEVLTKLPNTQAVLAQLNPYSGQANLDLNVSTGMMLNGRLDVTALALQTSEPNTSLQVPRLSLLFNNKTVTVPETSIYYGNVAINVSGQAEQPGRYQFRVASNEIPVSFLRDESKLLSSISGAQLPEIWNTAGSFALHGTVSNQINDFTVDFNNAGLSWRGSDFPLYDLNGSLLFKQVPKGKPIISSRDLTFKYGNSPMRVAIDNHEQFTAKASGVLSALTVNHFMVSRQTNATPYRDVPFEASASGTLAALPSGNTPAGKARQNDIRANIHLDLNHNLKEAYNNTTQQNEPDLPPESGSSLPLNEAAGPVAEPGSRNGRRSDGSILSLNPVRTVTNILGLANTTVQKSVNTLIPSGYENNEPDEPETPSAKTTPLPQPTVATSTSVADAQTQLSIAEPVSNDAYLNANLHWQESDLEIERAVLNLFDSGTLVAEGRLENLNDPERQAFLMHLVTLPEINLSRLSQGTGDNAFFKGASGTVGLNLEIAGISNGPKLASGWLNTNQIAIPFLTLQDLTGKLTLNGQTGLVEINSFKVPGISLGVNARTENIFEAPVSLEDVKIQGDLLSIASLTDFNNEIVKPILVDQIAHGFMRPWQQGDPTVPIQFRNADLHVNEVIFQNILLNNLSSNFSLYANSFFELTNTRLEAAGGVASGYLSMSPNDNNFMTLDLNVDRVKANALTKALLNTTNQIFGDLHGTIRFTTFGTDDVDMQKNANGTASMKVTNGRLPAIAKVETLLATANILRGGILGLNLNNLFRSLTIYDTNYFAELSGDMLINNQVLHTQNLVSDGVNLDLLIQGSLKMDDGSANMLVNGRMSQDVAGRFGAIGKLSLGRIVRFVPGLGNFGKNQTGLLGYIPGVGYVPGLGGPAGEYSRFQVRLQGPLDDPAAIRDFRWVRGDNL